MTLFSFCSTFLLLFFFFFFLFNYFIQIIATLQTQAGIQPSLTCLVWQKLEEQNSSFFYSYNVMLRVKDQLTAFNYLVDQQTRLLLKIQSPES